MNKPQQFGGYSRLPISVLMADTTTLILPRLLFSKSRLAVAISLPPSHLIAKYESREVFFSLLFLARSPFVLLSYTVGDVNDVS